MKTEQIKVILSSSRQRSEAGQGKESKEMKKRAFDFYCFDFFNPSSGAVFMAKKERNQNALSKERVKKLISLSTFYSSSRLLSAGK